MSTVQSNSQAKHMLCAKCRVAGVKQRGIQQQQLCKWSKHIGNAGLCVLTRDINKCWILFRECINVRCSSQINIKFIAVERRMLQPAIWCVYPGAERAGPEAHRTLTSSVDAKNGWIYTSDSSRRLLITFTFLKTSQLMSTWYMKVFD
jgi:hypothetical protein